MAYATSWGLVILILITWMVGAAYGWYMRCRWEDRRSPAEVTA